MARGLFALLLGAVVICFMLGVNLSAAEFPAFSVLANKTLLSSGDTVVIKCLIENVTLMDVVTSYTMTWLKDDVKITKSFTELAGDVIDTRYSVNVVAEYGKGFFSSLQIKSLREEDEGTFTCELINKTSAKQQKSVSISVEDRVGYSGTTDSGNRYVISRSNKTSIATEDTNETSSNEIIQPYENTTPSLLSFNEKEKDTTTHIRDIDTGTTDEETYNETITDSETTTLSQFESLVDITTGVRDVEFQQEVDSNGNLIAGILVPVLLILFSVITVVILERRNVINFYICFHKSKWNASKPGGKSYETYTVRSGNDSFIPLDCNEKYSDLDVKPERYPFETCKVDYINDSFSPDKTNETYRGPAESPDDYCNNEQAIRSRRAYEDANDKEFLTYYETKEILGRESTGKGGGNSVPGTLTQDDSTECFTVIHDEVSKKKKRSPYEKCHDTGFLDMFKI
ncbi:uncharacterized protein LOC133174685 [Saccostrea echinata]|uniref:uncharacterized protein LOC133174685 n=1 Tax=Saccostrea echinata TaxID=191078 RepID=UPI002A82C086|nr:uncharacterized protein LOC133174685 [Saccostrea echinata]